MLMLKRVKGSATCVHFAAVLLLSGCNPQQKSVAVPEMHEGDHLTSFSQEITSPIHEFQVKAGGTYILGINAKNAGTQPWFAGGQTTWVDASYRWLDGKGTVLPIEGKRTLLDRPVVQPGESDALKLQVVAPPAPGSYTLWVSMVQEGVAWFYDKGTKPLVLQVTVE